MSELENAILGAAIIDPEAAELVLGELQPEHFLRPQNRLTFEAIRSTHSELGSVDFLTILDKLGPSWEDHVCDLLSFAPSTSGVGRWIKRHMRHYQEERIRLLGIEMVDPMGDHEFGYLGSELEEIAKIGERKEVVSSKDAIIETMAILEEAFERGEKVGLSTGYRDLDEQIGGGLIEGAYSVLGARPSMGKSALALQIAQNVATGERPAPVLFVSIEMPTSEMMLRMISLHSRIPVSTIRQARFTDDQWADVLGVTASVVQMPIYWDDDPEATVEAIMVRAKAAVQKHGIRLIVIDYLQYIQTMQADRLDRRQQIEYISRGLKTMARKLNVHVMCLSQLSRQVEQRQDKRPMLSDLRETGGIEQDADLVLFLYRDEYYNRNSEDRGIAEVIVAKQRQGPVGTVKLAFQEQWARFADLSRERE